MPSLSSLVGGGIKSIQRGTAASAGAITITAVDITKTVVMSLGTGSAGTVAASASFNGNVTGGTLGASSAALSGGGNTITGTLSGGTTSGLFAGQYGCVLTNSTTITANGACTYQVVEYY
jgi:hypothetical protein